MQTDIQDSFTMYNPIEKPFAIQFFPLMGKDTRPRMFYLSTIIQRTSAEIINLIFTPGFVERIIPNLKSLVSKDNSSASWSLIQSDDVPSVMNIMLNTQSSLYWEVFHTEGTISGRVQFYELPENRGTFVNFISDVELHKDSIFRIVKNIFTNDDEYTLEDAVKRFKSVLETGHIPTTVGQPHGGREKQKGRQA